MNANTNSFFADRNVGRQLADQGLTPAQLEAWLKANTSFRVTAARIRNGYNLAR